MSEVIRDAVIRLRLETQRGKLEAPEMEKVARSYAEQRQQSEDLRRSVEATQKSVTESTKTHQRFGIHAARAFKDGLEGSIQFARGIALMSASGEEDTRKLLEMFAKIEAATALIRGASNLSKFATAFGPIGVAVGVTAAAVAAGAVVWKRYSDAIDEARRKANALEDALAAVREETRQAQEGINRQYGQATTDYAVTPEERTNRLERERIRAAQEFASIKAEQMASSWGKWLRGQTPQQRQQTLESLAVVNPEEVQKQKGIEQRLSESAKYQANIVKEQTEVQKKLLDAAQENQYNLGTAAAAFAASASGFGGFAGLGAAQTANAQTAQFDSAVSKVLRDAQQSLDRFVAIMRDAAERVREFEDALRVQAQANPK